MINFASDVLVQQQSLEEGQCACRRLANVEVGSIKLVTARVKAPKGDPGMTLMQRTYLEALQVHSGVAIHLGQCRRDRRWMESRSCEAHEVGAPALVATLVNDIALEKEQAG